MYKHRNGNVQRLHAENFTMHFHNVLFLVFPYVFLTFTGKLDIFNLVLRDSGERSILYYQNYHKNICTIRGISSLLVLSHISQEYCYVRQN